MKKLLFVFPIIVLLAAGCNLSQQNTNPAPTHTPIPSPAPTLTPTSTPAPTNSSNLLATINNSGSTNTLPYAINIFVDGSASVLVQNKPEQNFATGTVDTKTLLTMLQNIGDVGQIDGHCAKSVSFGTVTTITYNGKTSGDISCSFTGAAHDLYTFISQLEQQLKVSSAKRAL